MAGGVVQALRDAGLIERSLVSGMYTAELDAMARWSRRLRVGWSVPRLRRDYTTDMLTADPRPVDTQRLSRALAPARSCGPARRSFRRDHGPLASGHPLAGASGGRRRWRTIRLDSGRRRADRQVDRDGRGRDHHQRPALVRALAAVAWEFPTSTDPARRRSGRTPARAGQGSEHSAVLEASRVGPREALCLAVVGRETVYTTPSRGATESSRRRAA